MHYLELITEPENKLTFMATRELVSVFEQNYLANVRSSLNFLDETLPVSIDTFAIELYSPLFEEFKNKIRRLVEAGICPKKLNGRTTVKDARPRSEMKQPVMVLNMDDLAIGFLICLVPMALSCVVFVCELALPKMIALATKTRDLLTLLLLMRAVASSRFGFK